MRFLTKNGLRRGVGAKKGEPLEALEGPIKKFAAPSLSLLAPKGVFLRKGTIGKAAQKRDPLFRSNCTGPLHGKPSEGNARLRRPWRKGALKRRMIREPRECREKRSGGWKAEKEGRSESTHKGVAATGEKLSRNWWKKMTTRLKEHQIRAQKKKKKRVSDATERVSEQSAVK